MSLSISIPTAKALLKFASSDKTQPHIYGIGITRNGLAATDGFGAVEFYLPEADNLQSLVGRTLDRKVFETSMKLCAVTKSNMVITQSSTLVPDQMVFPNVSSLTMHAVRQPELPGTELVTGTIRVNPQYLALLDLVAVACETETIELVSCKTDGPLRFRVTGLKQSASVVISQG